MLPTTSTTIGNILKKSMQYHIPVYKKILPLILLMIIVKDFYLYLGGMPKNLLLEYIIGVVIIVLLIYFFVVSLYLADHVIKNKPITLSQAFKRCIPLMLHTYIAIFSYTVLFFALLYLSRYITYHDLTNIVKFIVVLIFGFIFLIFAVETFFAIPIIILDKMFPWFGFKLSVRLVSLKNWAHSLINVICLMAIILLLDPTTLHGYLLENYYLNAPFDFVVLSVFLPFFNNLIIFSLNDLKLKQKEKEQVTT